MSKSVKSKAELLRELAQFHGSTCLYYHPFFKSMNYTEGAQYVFNHCQSVWLCVDIMTYLKVHCKGQEFVVVTLKVKEKEDKTKKADLIFDDGNSNVIFKHHYNFTDFPLDKIQFFYENNILYLPSER